MSNRPVNPCVAALFKQLADQHGFTLGQVEHSTSFGQLMQVAESTNLRVRFIRDRGDEYLEIGCRNEWFSIDLVRLILFGGRPTVVPADLQSDASFLSEHAGTIEELLLPENQEGTLKSLNNLRVEKARYMFPSDFFIERDG